MSGLARSQSLSSQPAASLWSPRVQLASAAAASSVIVLLTMRLAGTPLPHDGEFNATIYLMWSGNLKDQQVIGLLNLTLLAAALMLPLVLVAAAVIFPRHDGPIVAPLRERAYRYALVFPLFILLSFNLPRVVANTIYAILPAIHWDLTPTLAAIEAPLLEWIQTALRSDLLSRVCSGLYSVVWFVLIFTAGPLAILRDRFTAAIQVLIGAFLVAVLAIPFFVLLPVYDPWITNQVYGYRGGVPTQVEYLYWDVQPPLLKRVATEFPMAAASCLPSLHVAYPLVLGLLLRRNSMRVMGTALLVLSGLTGLAVVYLGRHWVVDIILAVPYAFGIARLAEYAQQRVWGPVHSRLSSRLALEAGRDRSSQ